jgi:hypothetical protein
LPSLPSVTSESDGVEVEDDAGYVGDQDGRVGGQQSAFIPGFVDELFHQLDNAAPQLGTF